MFTFKIAVSVAMVLSLSGTAFGQQRIRTWRVSGPPNFSIATRLAVEGRTDPWTNHRVQLDQAGRRYARFSLQDDRRGYDIRITPLDANGRQTQEPLNSKQPVIWSELPDSLVVAFGIEIRPNGREYYPAASIPIAGRGNTFDLEDYDNAIKSLFHRTWNTTYTDLSGNSQNAVLQLQERSGSYQGVVRGTLSSIHYFPATDEDKVIVDGTWASGQTKGVFVFAIDVNNGPGAFEGKYRLAGEQRWRSWNGTPR